METLLTWTLTALVGGYLVWGFRRPETVYEFPFLGAVMTVSFLLPQLPAMIGDPFLPPGAYTKMVAMTILCLIALGIGWSLPARPFRFLRQVFEERRLLWLAAGFSLIGAYFYAELSRLPGDLSVGVQMTGLPVVYSFFARFMTYGLAIAVLCFVRRPSWPISLVIAFDLVFYLDRIVVTGKRAESIELLLIVALSLWFQRRWKVPRAATLSLVALGTFAMVSMSDYRDVTRANSGPVWEQIAQIDVAGNFFKLLEQGGPEARNAVLRIDSIDAAREFDFGAFHWDRIVEDYVPAQLVGSAIKSALLIPMPHSGGGYDPPVGTTDTGMADAFQSFWYFGALKFMLLAYLIRRIWNTAMAGHAAAQILFMLSIVPAMHAISHETDWVVSVWVHILLFLAPALYFCRVRPRPAVATSLATALPRLPH